MVEIWRCPNASLNVSMMVCMETPRRPAVSRSTSTCNRKPSFCASEATSSLAHDLSQGHRLELETLHGHAVRLAERLGVKAPTLLAVYAALKPHAEGRSR